MNFSALEAIRTQAYPPLPGKARPALAAVPVPRRGVPAAGDLVAAALARPARPEGAARPGCDSIDIFTCGSETAEQVLYTVYHRFGGRRFVCFGFDPASTMVQKQTPTKRLLPNR